HRRRVFVEGPLAEVVVVRVDLTRPLGRDEHARIVRVDAFQQLVEAGLDHSCAPSGGSLGGPPMVAASSTSSSTARSRSSFTITRLNSCRAASSSLARARRRSI